MIAVAASRGKFGGMVTTKFRADAQGRFTANPFPGDYFRVNAFALEGQPYLVPAVEFAWTKGAVKKVIDIQLPRGVLIRGKVTEQGTGRSLAGPAFSIWPLANASTSWAAGKRWWPARTTARSQIVVPPGKGHLLVFGPTSDYILEVIGVQMLYRGQPGGTR